VKVLGALADERAAPSLTGPANAEYAPSDSPSAATAATVNFLIDIDNVSTSPHFVRDPFSAQRGSMAF
jgi:hypothetical protein